MGDVTSSSLQPLVDRMRLGDQEARREFLGYVEDRVHKLARRILNVRWGRLRQVTDSHSVANRVFARLLTKDQLTTPTLEDFMRYCAWLVDKQLRDIAKRKKRRPGDYGNGTGEGDVDSFAEVQGNGPRPSTLVEGTELLERIEALPKDLRDIVYLHGYLDLTQSVVAELLRLPPWKVSRRWKNAKQLLNGGSPAESGKSDHDKRP